MYYNNDVLNYNLTSNANPIDHLPSAIYGYSERWHVYLAMMMELLRRIGIFHPVALTYENGKFFFEFDNDIELTVDIVDLRSPHASQPVGVYTVWIDSDLLTQIDIASFMPGIQMSGASSYSVVRTTMYAVDYEMHTYVMPP
jgi:hypothetical protein